MDEQTVMTQEEVNEHINSGDMDVINKVLSNEITIDDNANEPKPPTPDEVLDVPVVSEAYADKTREDVVSEFVKPVVVDEPTATDPLEDIKLQQKNALAEIEELKKQLSQKSESTVNTEAPSYKPIVLDGEEGELEYASPVSRNNRKLIEELKQSVTTSDSAEMREMKEQLSKLQAVENSRIEEEKRVQATRAEEETRVKLFNEIRGLQSTSEHFKTGSDIKDVFNEYGSFKTRMADFIGSENGADINRAVYAAIKGTSERDVALQAKIKESGIQIPTEGSKYIDIAQVVDLKNGVKFDPETGSYTEITDEDGRRVNQRTIDDAYKLSTYYSNIADAEKSASKQVQKKLQTFSDSATTMGNERTASQDDMTRMSIDEMQNILNLPSSTIRSNPELKAKFDRIMEQL